MLSVTYYAQNYAGIIGWSLTVCLLVSNTSNLNPQDRLRRLRVIVWLQFGTIHKSLIMRFTGSTGPVAS